MALTRHFVYEPDEEDLSIEFRLIYEGPLRAERCEENASGRARDKHALRKHFHLQMRELWDVHPQLRELSRTRFFRKSITPASMATYPGPSVEQVHEVLKTEHGAKTWKDHIADEHVLYSGNRFIPLISERKGFTCALDILFLRRDNPGNLIENGGDIDNRIKVLLDGLRMPRDLKELGGFPIDPDEDPFYCLLEDDRLVSRISVTTDQLLTPKNQRKG